MSVNNMSDETYKIRKEKISILDNKIQNLELKFENVLKKYNINLETLLEKQKQVYFSFTNVCYVFNMHLIIKVLIIIIIKFIFFNNIIKINHYER